MKNWWRNKMDEFTIKDVKYKEECYCEHCGDLEPFTATFEDGCDWCIWCGLNGDLHLSEEDQRQISIMEAKHKLKYFTKRAETQREFLEQIGELDEEN
ncbi:hypothetical protein PQE74_gp211 [Bacillus phage vB_BanS_Chewbecca]|uniref:Uncharacterized protein n=1 Tax=Bacillus phage vB_BanS_Chewbecca TaxID=2894786 RepID=A0AAE8YMZ3_9CAUD|nr:hypothetical protein PQE74_gp211 [Bacillus phage vB_BanS_Chewbecca]UGO46319.1 hypothetical protein CHEWBECCA_256 [Bacillus phage vB_BanS_Chewbecca]